MSAKSLEGSSTHTRFKLWGYRADIQNHHPGDFAEFFRHLVSEPTAASCDHDQLRFARRAEPERSSGLLEVPHVQRKSSKGVVDSPDDPDDKENFQGFNQCRDSVAR